MTFGTRGREYKSKILFPVNLELMCRLGGKIEVNEKNYLCGIDINSHRDRVNF